MVDAKTIVCGLVLFGLANVSVGQTGPATPVDQSIKIDVEVVNVLCDVYDPRGMLVKDLHKDQFRVSENGKPQEIRYFAQESDLPLTVAILIDVSGSVRLVIEEEKATAGQFLQRILRPDDQALLMGFASNVILWQDFTSSMDLLHKNLDRLRAVPIRSFTGLFAGTVLYDAVYLTATEKMRDITGRKAIVILSDGVDTGSQMKLPAAVQALQDSNTVAYGICYEPAGGAGGCSYLKDIATPTGGRSFKVTKKVSLSKVFQTIEDEIRSQYAIGYVSSNPAHDGTFRKLDVKTRSGRYHVQTRKGYRAVLDPPPLEAKSAKYAKSK